MIAGASTGPRPTPRFSFDSLRRYELIALKLDSRAERSTRAVVQRTTTTIISCLSAAAMSSARWDARVDHRSRPPRTDDNAKALPSSSQDAGNRISFARLRGFAGTRDSDFRADSTESRVQSV